MLDAYEQVIAARPDLNPRRLRIEHFLYFSENDVARAVRLGVVLSIQSNFNARMDEEVPFGLARVGAPLSEGSDYFAMSGPPLAGFSATLGRKYAVGQALPDAEARRLAYRANARMVRSPLALSRISSSGLQPRLRSRAMCSVA